jgi:hypothetical protein
MRSRQHQRQVGDSGSLVGDADDEDLRARLAFEEELRLASARMPDDVARHFGHGGGQPHLILRIEAEEARELPGPLSRHDHVLLLAKLDGEQLCAHECSPCEAIGFSASTVTSSVPRA